MYTNRFGGASPGNNPGYLTSFVGVTNNGTGDGVAGDILTLFGTSSATGALQFDFLSPLTPQDRILLMDVDDSEQYLLQAYVFNGSSYDQVGLTGWIAGDFSGQTGITPDDRWPVWNPAAGTVTSGTNGDVYEELFVLTPAQNINRLVITKLSGPGWETGITFLSLATNSFGFFFDDFSTFAPGNLAGQYGWQQLGSGTANPLQVTGGAVLFPGGLTGSLAYQTCYKDFPLTTNPPVFLGMRIAVTSAVTNGGNYVSAGPYLMTTMYTGNDGTTTSGTWNNYRLTARATDTGTSGSNGGGTDFFLCTVKMARPEPLGSMALKPSPPVRC